MIPGTYVPRSGFPVSFRALSPMVYSFRVMSITVDAREIRRLERELRVFHEKAARAASAVTLNRLARGARALAKRRVEQTMTLRNKWTLGSIQSTNTPLGRPIGQQFTLVGSRQEYMAKQHEGGRLKRTKEGRRLTTARGSREGDAAFPRKKLARGMNRISKIKVAPRNQKRRGKMSAGVAAHIQVKEARKKGFRFAYLRLGRDNAGLFDVKRKRIKMVHRIMREPLRVKSRPWLEPAADEMRQAGPRIWARAVMAEVAKVGLFR